VASHRSSKLFFGGLLVWWGDDASTVFLSSLAGGWRAPRPLYPLPPARGLIDGLAYYPIFLNSSCRLFLEV
jgi:hypothetical protein